MDRFIKIATIPLLIGIAVLSYMTLAPPKSASPPAEPAVLPAESQPDDPAEAPTAEPPAANPDTPDEDATDPADGVDSDPLVKDPAALAELGPYIPMGQVEKRGTGPVNMILISGNGETWEIWESFMERNADRYTMWAVAMPGFGGGPIPPIGEDERSYLRQPWLKNAGRALLGLIIEEGIDDPVLMGRQIGGTLAVYVSLTHPAWVNSVISLDGEPAYLLGDPTFRMTVRDRITLVTTQMDPQFANMTPLQWSSRQRGTPEKYIRDPERGAAIGEMIAQAPMRAMQQYLMEFSLSDLTKPLSDAKKPILFVAPFYRVEDEAFRTDRQVRWFDMLADAPGHVEVVWFYDSSSWITEDQPEYLDAAVQAFLAGEQPEGSPPFDPFAEDTPDDQ